ncbi:MAG: DUF4834 family protein [Saonia sp.]
MGLLKTVLIILLVYYLLKILARWFAPKLFGFAARKAEAHFRERFGEFGAHTTANEQHVGDVIINKNTAKKSDTSKKVGDYIDFEEID